MPKAGSEEAVEPPVRDHSTVTFGLLGGIVSSNILAYSLFLFRYRSMPRGKRVLIRYGVYMLLSFVAAGVGLFLVS